MMAALRATIVAVAAVVECGSGCSSSGCGSSGCGSSGRGSGSGGEGLGIDSTTVVLVASVLAALW